jgi:anaerobic selenocysteine-containing dehydrogenase
METLAHSVCPLDCPDRCSLEVTVRDAQVVKVGGSRHNPLTAGFICAKVAKFGRRVHGPERILWPAVRTGPKGPGARFERVSWDEALDLIVARWRVIIAESGAEALLPYWYGGSNGYLTGGGLDAHLWAKLGATRVERTLCATNAGAAVSSVYGDLPGNDPVDVAEAQLAVLWGVNPHASGVHLVPYVKRVLDRGGELLLVDPRATPFASKAVVHLRPLPGTDVAVALAGLHLAFVRGWADRAFLDTWAEDAAALEAWVERWTPARAAQVSDVPAADIERFAERYAAAAPAMIRCGWGVERTRNGTDAIRAILSLPAVYGKFGVRGGGYAMSTSAGYRLDKGRITPPHAARSINMSRLGRELLERADPPIRALYVYDCNPVATVPDQERVIRGLSRDDLFTVVHEQVWNDSCDYADVVLPATTFLEHHELSRSYGGYVLQWASPAIPPVGESRPNHAVITELGRRLGVEGLERSEEDIARAVVDALPTAPAGSWERLQADRFVKLPSFVQFVDVFPSRKLRLVDDAPPRYREPPVDAERPLILISPASPRGISSTLFETLGVGQATVGLHPDDAARFGVTEGAEVRVFNSVGEARLRAALDPGLRPGVAEIPKGTWRRSTLDGRTGNALVPDHVDERGAGACYNDARVSVERVG